MTLKGQLQNFTSGQGHVMTQADPNRSYWTSFDAPWCAKHNEPILKSVSLRNQKLLAKKNLRSPWVTSNGLYRGHCSKLAPGSSWMAKGNTILRELRRSDAYLWNGKHLNISPLTYNGEVIEVSPQVTGTLRHGEVTKCHLRSPGDLRSGHFVTVLLLWTSPI